MLASTLSAYETQGTSEGIDIHACSHNWVLNFLVQAFQYIFLFFLLIVGYLTDMQLRK